MGDSQFINSQSSESEGEEQSKDGRPRKRTKSIKQVEEEQDDFTKNFNNRDEQSHRYTSRREKNYEDPDSEDSQNDQDSVKDTGAIMYMDTLGNKNVLKPNMRFLNYKEIFKNLLKQNTIVTKWPIVTMAISYDSTRAITVTKEDDRTSYIKMYDLNTNELTFEEKIGGQPD
jgi:hypothetical protein